MNRKSNIEYEIFTRINKDNEISTSYYSTKIQDCNLLCSRLVGKIQLRTNLLEDKFYCAETIIAEIHFLSIVYPIAMERDAYLKKIYCSNGIIEYGTPLFLFF